MTAVDKKVTDLTEITPVVTDVTYVVDVSDTTDDPAGTSKKTTFQKILDLLQPLILTAAALLKWNADKIQDIDVDDTAPTDNQVLTYDDASSKWKPAPAGTASPLTTKGDLYGYDTTNNRIPIGDDGEVLTADSTDDQGVAWKAASGTADVVGEVPTGTPNGTLTDFTIAQAPITGTLKVFVNGVRQKITDDYTFTGTTITFVSAPLTDSKIQVDYKINTGDFSTGSASWINNETPAGTIDGSNKTFTLASTPVNGSLYLFRDGQLMTGGGADYTLTTNSIAFVTAPVTGSVLLAFYQSAVSTAGNADLLDGQHAPTGTIVGTSDTQTLTNKTLTSPNLNEAVAVTTTATELNNLHSKTLNLGAWTSFDPTFTGINIGTTGTKSGYYCQIGKTVFFKAGFVLGGTGISFSASNFLTLPVTPSSTAVGPYSRIGIGGAFNATDTFPLDITGNGQIFYTATGGTAIIRNSNLSSTAPFTWAATNTLYLEGFYEAA